jgi:RNA recognition motif-containing protein
MPSKLYVGNLAYSVRNEHLQELFSQAGKVESVAVITDKFSGESKGFGFVEMSDAAEAAKAISSFDGSEFMGRNLKVSEAKPRPQGGGSSFGGGGGGGGGGNRSGGGGGRGGNKRW